MKKENASPMKEKEKPSPEKEKRERKKVENYVGEKIEEGEKVEKVQKPLKK